MYISNQEDKLLWAPTHDGKYSVRDGYVATRHMETQQVKSRAFIFSWNSVVLPKAGCFAWLALRKRILTSDKLERLHITNSFACVLCKVETETVDHLLLRCPFAQQFWLHVVEKQNLSMPLPYTLWELFQSRPTLFTNCLFASIWKCIPTTVIWSIWWERNKRIFRQIESPTHLVLEGIEKYASEQVNAYINNISSDAL